MCYNGLGVYFSFQNLLVFFAFHLHYVSKPAGEREREQEWMDARTILFWTELQVWMSLNNNKKWLHDSADSDYFFMHEGFCFVCFCLSSTLQWLICNAVSSSLFWHCTNRCMAVGVEAVDIQLEHIMSNTWNPAWWTGRAESRQTLYKDSMKGDAPVLDEPALIGTLNIAKPHICLSWEEASCTTYQVWKVGLVECVLPLSFMKREKN